MAGFDELLTAFEANTKVEHRSHVIKMINYSFECVPPPPHFFNTLFNLKQSQEVCSEAVTLLVSERFGTSNAPIGTGLGEPACNQYRCSEDQSISEGWIQEVATEG